MLACHLVTYPKNPDPSYGNTRPSKRDTPGASKQVFLTPHDIPRILKVKKSKQITKKTDELALRCLPFLFHAAWWKSRNKESATNSQGNIYIYINPYPNIVINI